MAHASPRIPAVPRRATPQGDTTPARRTRSAVPPAQAGPSGHDQASPGAEGKASSTAAARALALARTPATVRIAVLRDTVRRLLETNRRLRQQLAASEDRVRALTEERGHLLTELADARIDPLSGLAVRRAFTRNATELLRATGHRYCLLLLDLDEFKPVNDQFGHAAGDAVLTEVGARITRWLGPTETAARSGGDEFVVMAAQDARLLARIRALREAIAEPVAYQDLHLTVGVTVGSAEVTDGLSKALGEADQAMYKAKGSGRRGRSAITPGHA